MHGEQTAKQQLLNKLLKTNNDTTGVLRNIFRVFARLISRRAVKNFAQKTLFCPSGVAWVRTARAVGGPQGLRTFVLRSMSPNAPQSLPRSEARMAHLPRAVDAHVDTWRPRWHSAVRASVVAGHVTLEAVHPVVLPAAVRAAPCRVHRSQDGVKHWIRSGSGAD